MRALIFKATLGRPFHAVDSQQDTEAVTEDGANLMDTGAKVISNSQLKKLRQNKQNKKLKRLKKKRLEKGRF